MDRQKLSQPISDDMLVKIHERDLSGSASESQISSARMVGIIGLAYAASVISQNLVFIISGAPDYRDPLTVVLTYHAQNAGAMSIATGFEAVNLVLFLLFVVSLHGLIERRKGGGTDFSRLAIAAGSALSVLFALMIATHMATVLVADGLTEPSPTFALIWRLHASIFALALPALGTTMIAAALATHASGLTRSWQRMFALGGGILLILAGLGNLAIANGSPLVYVGVLGLAVWLVWVITTSIRLIRR